MITFRKINGIVDIHFINEVRNQYSEEYLHDSRTFTLSESYDWFKKMNPDWYIILNNDNPIGYFRLSNYSEENMNIYVGADISPEHTGKGFGYLSYETFLPYLFDEYGLNKVSLEVLATNERAIHLYKKIGFVVEGVKREEVLKKGILVDSIIMSILRSELKWKI